MTLDDLEPVVWYTCLRKQRLDQATAQERAKAIGLNVYTCSTCGQHHVGTPPKGGINTAKTRRHARQALARDIARGRVYIEGAPVPLDEIGAR